MSQPQKPYHHLDLAAIRARLEQSRGREYWRSLEELAASIKVLGVLQPILVRRVSDGDDTDNTYEKNKGGTQNVTGLIAKFI